MTNQTLSTRAILIDLAAMYGIREEVEQLIENLASVPSPVSLPTLLSKQRHITGISRNEACRRSNMSKSQAASYEADKLKNPGLRTLTNISKGYGLPFWVVLHAVLLDLGMDPTPSAPGALKHENVRRRKRRSPAHTPGYERPPQAQSMQGP